MEFANSTRGGEIHPPPWIIGLMIQQKDYSFFMCLYIISQHINKRIQNNLFKNGHITNLTDKMELELKVK